MSLSERLLVVGGAHHESRPEVRTRYEYRAYCSSRTCTGRRPAHAPIEKKVTRDADECPDCGFALFWQTKRLVVQSQAGLADVYTMATLAAFFMAGFAFAVIWGVEIP